MGGIRYSLLLTVLLLPSAHGVCVGTFRSVLSGKVILADTNLVELLRAARSPDSLNENKPASLLLRMAEAALMKAPNEIANIDLLLLPTDLIPTAEELRARYPWLRHRERPLSPAVLNGFQKMALQEDLIRFSRTAARRLHERSTPKERRALAQQVLNSVNRYGAHEMPQSKLDSLVNGIIGLETRQVTDGVSAMDPAEIREKYGDEEVWAEHGATNLLTRYRLVGDILSRFEVEKGSRVVDIGSGVGSVGTYIGIMRPDLEVEGFELVTHRVQEASRVARELGLDRVKYVEQNLALPSFRLPPADLYYAFNPTSGPTFDKILADLKANASENPRRFRFVVTGPAPVDKILSQKWLKEVTPEVPFPGDVEVRIFEFTPVDLTRVSKGNPPPRGSP